MESILISLKRAELYFANIFRKQFSDLFFSGSKGFNSGLLEPSIAGLEYQNENKNQCQEDLKESGFLWGVPKKRRTKEVRWCRNMGAENWVWKMHVPKTNIRICETCGHHHEAKRLCKNCYEKILSESESIRKKFEHELGWNPENKEMFVLYKGEKENVDPKSYENKYLVEVPNTRPSFFSKNLLQKSTVGIDKETVDIAPKKELG